jgi:hypothetical protein
MQSMPDRTTAARSAALMLAAFICGPWTLHSNVANAQGGPPRPAAPANARAAAPVDLTGYWVSVISEDWRWRMTTPLRGDFASIPLNPEGQRVGLAWDPDADEAAGLACRAYGAAAIMRRPGRLHITWQDEDTLEIEADEGQQTRLLHFDTMATPPGAPSWQGLSVANWERPASGMGERDPIGLFVTRIADRGRALEGPPYSDQTTVREYFDYFRLPNGDEWFTVTTIVEDPVYLREPFITSSDFKKQRNSDGYNPTPCSAR